ERRGDERAEPEDRHDGEREADLLPQVGRAEDASDGTEHDAPPGISLDVERGPCGPRAAAPGGAAVRRIGPGWGYLTEPPAATIFCSAELETLSTETFSLTAISPV